MRNVLFYSLIGMALFATVGCKKNTVAEPLTEEQKALYYINKSIFDAVNEYYLWYANIPKTLDYKQEPKPFFNGMKYTVNDRWSFIISKGDFYLNFLGGNVSGSHGFDVAPDPNGVLRVVYIYPNTESYKTGIRRGWKLLKVNDQNATYANFFQLQTEAVVGSVDKFQFQNDTGMVNFILTKHDFIAPSVLEKDTLRVGNTVVAYLMFNEFRGTDSQVELDSAFDFFNKCNATELVLDMRYNGGGMNETAHHLGNLIAGKKLAGEVFVKYTFNDKLAKDNNESVLFKSLPNSMNSSLSRIYIIGTQNTASASEIIINCLKPFMNVYLIGSTTHGKPVGMNVLELKYYDYVLAPISFISLNKNNEGDYYTGIAPTYLTSDDITHDFGNRNEWCLAQALAHIASGSFNATLKSATLNDAPVRLRKAFPFPMSINKIITIE